MLCLEKHEFGDRSYDLRSLPSPLRDLFPRLRQATFCNHGDNKKITLPSLGAVTQSHASGLLVTWFCNVIFRHGSRFYWDAIEGLLVEAACSFSGCPALK